MGVKKAFIKEYLEDLNSILVKLDTEAIEKAVLWLREARDNNRTIFICGNGGSEAIASQMVVDILKGASYGRNRRFRIINLAVNLETITAYGNDADYSDVFVEPLKNFAEKGDILIGISGSGNSPNVIKAVEYATESGLKTIGITTTTGGMLREMAGLLLSVPSTHMGRLEDSFFIITHILCYAFIEDELF